MAPSGLKPHSMPEVPPTFLLLQGPLAQPIRSRVHLLLLFLQPRAGPSPRLLPGSEADRFTKEGALRDWHGLDSATQAMANAAEALAGQSTGQRVKSLGWTWQQLTE